MTPDSYTLTPEPPYTRLRLADGREGLFVSATDAEAEGARLTSGVLSLALPAPMPVNLRIARERDAEAEAVFWDDDEYIKESIAA